MAATNDSLDNERNRPRDLFEAYRRRVENGEVIDFDEFCAGHAEHADVLRFLNSLYLSSPEALSTATDIELAAALGVDASGTTLAEGERLGNYRIVRPLGVGGMGIVYLAEQEEPVRRQVALKLIKLGMDTLEVIARFERERRILARLEHPNIARVYDAGSTPDGRPYFVMEYVPGVSIVAYCNEHELGLADRLELFRQVCAGIHHAHCQGVIHRDIKSTNILVSEVDGKPLARIIDFGVSRATDRLEAEQTLYTQLGRSVGTPAFMSPEQAGGAPQEIDQRTDIYSLGALLYELLTDLLPLDTEALRGASLEEILRTVREEPALPPSTRFSRINATRRHRTARRRDCDPAHLERSLRGDLDWITLKALEKEPARRYASAAELSSDIDRHRRHEPVLAGPPGKLYQLSKFVRRYRLLVASTGLVLLVLAIGFAVSTFFAILASDRLDEISRLADSKLLEDLKTEAQSLWPATPSRIDDLEDWIARAETLAGRIELHRQTLERTREARRALAYITESDDDSARSRSTSRRENELEWRLELLEELVLGLEKFQDSDPHMGTMASVRDRLHFARTVERRSLVEPAARWQEALRSIADRSRCPAYDGLELEPQLGLVPLGRNPRTGLWEFGHLQTGEAARREEDGSLRRDVDTGLVFVLLPGGRFRMGAVRSATGEATNVDPFAEADESPVHEVELEPFFVSKYEMTQAQWRRFTGDNPSRYRAGGQVGELALTAQHPVETVDREVCERVLRSLGLALPTESQWEYAARAGNPTTWWSGDERESLQGHENLADRSLAASYQGESATESWDDGFAIHAPVGTFRPHPWGLHDIAGNVREWCRDVYSETSYELAPREGDGLRAVTGGDQHVVRGGSWARPAIKGARSADRGAVLKGVHDLGVRPVRALERSGP